MTRSETTRRKKMNNSKPTYQQQPTTTKIANKQTNKKPILEGRFSHKYHPFLPLPQRYKSRIFYALVGVGEKPHFSRMGEFMCFSTVA